MIRAPAALLLDFSSSLLGAHQENTMTAPISLGRTEPARARLEPLLTIEDLERLLRVHRRTIARMVKRGELPPPLKVGSSNRWKVEDIEKVLGRKPAR
jgi:excisionase family DNA binding protein